jgi:flavoprotein hydroxylase
VLQRGPDGSRLAEVGHLTPQYRVGHRGATALLDDITGGGFTVLTDGAAPVASLDAAEWEFLAAIGATVVPLYARQAPPEGYLDADHGYLPHLRERGHIAAVVRPDFYLFGTASTTAGLHELLGQLRDQLRVLR